MKSIQQKTALLVIAAIALWTTPANVRADSIGVNFGVPVDALSPTDVAGVSGFSQSHYNNVFSTPTNLILNDDAGAATTVTLTLPGSVTFGDITAVAPSGPDETLNRGAAFGNFSDFSLTLSNIPYASYSILVYSLAQQDVLRAITVDGTTFYSRSPPPSANGYVDLLPATPYLYTQATSTDLGSPTRDSNYMLFTGLSGANQTIFVAGENQRNISGFQIVQTVPEPSTWAMLLGALSLLGFFKRPDRRCSWLADPTRHGRLLVLKPSRAT